MRNSLWPHLATAVSVQPLDFRPSPRCFSEELQAGSNAGVVSETANGDLAPHFLPADVLDQPLQHHGQSDSVQRIQGTLSSHTIQAKPGSYLFCEVCSDGASPTMIVTFTTDCENRLFISRADLRKNLFRHYTAILRRSIANFAHESSGRN